MANQNRQPIALISVHGDPTASVGREEAGGQNVYVRNVGEKLANLGWQVDMFTRKTDYDQPNIVQHSPYCRTIRIKAGPECFIPRDQLFAYMPEFLNSFQIWQNKQTIIYPLIHTNYWLSAWIGLELQKHSKIQLIHTYHSLGVVKYNSIAVLPAIAKIRLAIEKEILENADCVVATSPQEQESLRNLISSHGNIVLIPCGTDTDNFNHISQTAARLKLGFAKSEKIVLYVGRFDPRKGIETLLRSCAQILPDYRKDLKLIIVGGSSANRADGQERERIEKILQELSLEKQTIFAGQIGHQQLPLYYCAADVCVIPSHYEPFGLVAIESMACGTPVVASDVGGLRFTVLPEETGLLVPPKDINAFSQAIKRILNDELLAGKMRKQASASVNQNFSWKHIGIQLSDLYRRTLAQSIMKEPIVYMPELINAKDNSMLVIRKK